ncbi:MAG: hypothetical protein K2J40_01965 [Ruminococcus sp.]|nr:hypothetical protein [Ruminococcus sp.]
MEKQYGKLTLGGATFELDSINSTGIIVSESDEYDDTIIISFFMDFEKGVFNGEEVTPVIDINDHETRKSGISELVGEVYSVDSPEEADEREDTLYIYEHEPFEKYSLKILEVSGEMVHISIEGTAITDGYLEPYQTADFSGDLWLKWQMM